MARLRTGIIALPAAAALSLSLCLAPNTAFAASTMDQLNAAYTNALRGYEDALAEQDQNAAEIAVTEQKIEEAEQLHAQTQAELNETAVTLYKETRGQNTLVDILLSSESFQDAVMRFETYERVETHCVNRINELIQQRDSLAVQKVGLEAEKVEIEQKVEQKRLEAEKAEKALKDAAHADGDKFHQVQGNGDNCGATAFIVGVNILLDEERYKDNVAVWEGPGFEKDSTTILASRANTWLKANDLDDEIGVKAIAGDIHTTAELKEQLQEGNVVVISSGDGSVWRYANGKKVPAGSHSAGHWVVFYYYDNGKFYCNDSSTSASKGAGAVYTTKQMQQWLDGRDFHAATVVYLK